MARKKQTLLEEYRELVVDDVTKLQRPAVTTPTDKPYVFPISKGRSLEWSVANPPEGEGLPETQPLLELKDQIQRFIELNPDVSLQNVIRLFGNCQQAVSIIKYWFPALVASNDPELVYHLPLNAFDGITTKLDAAYASQLIVKVKALLANLGGKDLPIVLNKKEERDFAKYLDSKYDNPAVFAAEISTLTKAYDHVLGFGHHVSKVRETLHDFQPMNTERISKHILDKIKLRGVNIFLSMSDFIRVFTDDELQALATDLDLPCVKMELQVDRWFGRFGPITLTIHVIAGRPGTGVGLAIKPENVIQAALLYKDRKNDFIRAHGARKMVKYCKTEWINPQPPLKAPLKTFTSNANGTMYTFSCLYTGDVIVQEFKGNLPPYADAEIPFISVFPKVHKAGGPSKIFTNQEHIVAVYVASCAIKSECFSETVDDNLQIITVDANNDVNDDKYAAPLGKFNYLVEKNQQKLKNHAAARFEQIGILQFELNDEKGIGLTLSQIDKSIGELVTSQKTNQIEVDTLTGTLTKAQLSRRSELLKMIGEDVTEQGALEGTRTSLTKLARTRPPSLNETQRAIKQQQLVDLATNQEFLTRRAMLMARLANVSNCCLNPAKKEDAELMRRRGEIVVSCAHSISVIIECAKIGLGSVTVDETEHARLIENSDELKHVRALAQTLFKSYHLLQGEQDVSDKYLATISTQTLDLIAQVTLLVRLTKGLLTEFIKTKWENAVLKKKIAYLEKKIVFDAMTGPKDLVQAELMALEADYVTSKDKYDSQSSEISALFLNVNLLAGIYEPIKRAIDSIREKCQSIFGALSSIGSSSVDVVVGMLSQVLKREEPFLDTYGYRAPTISDLLAKEEFEQVREEYESSVDPEEQQDTLEGFIFAGLDESAVQAEIIGHRRRSSRNVTKVESYFPPTNTKKPPKPPKQPKEKLASKRAEELKLTSKSKSSALLKTKLKAAKGNAFDEDALLEKSNDPTQPLKSLDSFTDAFTAIHSPAPSISDELSEEIKRTISTNTDIMDAAQALMALTGAPKGAAEEGGAAGGAPKSYKGGAIEDIDTYIENNDISNLFNLYMEHFDEEEHSLKMCQVYSILMSQSIYVPVYRCYSPVTLSELMETMIERRDAFIGDLNEFDTMYSDSFCIQLFGKNVNVLLNDLSKGTLTVPTGAFPNNSSNPFEPHSLICILELLRLLCIALPYSFRLHFYEL
jgi:hypothetical protein